MLLKIFGNRSKKKHSISFLPGSQKPPSSRPQTKEPDTASVQIERQPIPPEIEAEIRYACTLLYYSVEHGVPLPYSHRYQPPASDKEAAKGDPARKDKHDSGIGMDDQPSNQTSASSGTSRFYRQQSQRRLKDWSSPGTSGSSSPRSLSTAHWLVDENIVQYSNTGGRVGIFLSENPARDARSEEVLLDPETIAMFRRVPSFLWSLSECPLSYDQHIDNPQSSSHPESRRHSTISEHILPHPTESDGYPKDSQNRSGTTTAPAAPPEKNPPDDSGTVVANEDGPMHAVSAAEEAQRQSDLQRAISGKMNPGAIGANSSSQESKTTEQDEIPRFPTLPKTFRSQFLDQKRSVASSGVELGYSQTQAQIQPQPRRTKPGLLRKLSMIGIGWRNTTAGAGAGGAPASGERDSVGLSRVVEAA